MSSIESIILGIVQGITEFLPISSSGHLVLVQQMLGFDKPPVFFDIVLHVGTLTSVLIYFYQQIIGIKFKLLKTIIIASIPAGILGILLEPVIEKIFGSLMVVGVGLIITSILLLLSSRLRIKKKILTKKTKLNNISFTQGLIIGVFQSIAIFPGVSRSGSTVTAGLFLNLKRKAAFAFSFLLSIPAILGAQLLGIVKIENINLDVTTTTIGFISAAISGFVSLKILDKVISQSKLHYFGYYCFALGLTILFLNT